MSTAEMSGPASDLLTFDDFCAIVRDGQKADLLDGVIYIASPDSNRSNQINGLLDFLVRVFGERFYRSVAIRIRKSRLNPPIGTGNRSKGTPHVFGRP